MKTLIIFFVAWFSLTPLFGQKIQESGSDENKPGRFEVKFAAGTTLTMIPDFNNYVLVANEMLIPNFIHPTNAANISIIKGHSKSKSLLGWFVEAEVSYRLPKNYSLSLSVGVKKLRFDYQTELTDLSGSLNLDDLNNDFGHTTLLYLNIAPFNISKGFLQNRLSVQAGPVLNWLLDNKIRNTLVVYNSSESVQNKLPDAVFFDTTGKFKKILLGLNLGVEYKIVDPLGFKVSAQYYFNSLLEDKGVYDGLFQTDVDKVKPLSVQAGLTFTF